MSKQKGTKIIVVTGDVTIDWNVARKKDRQKEEPSASSIFE